MGYAESEDLAPYAVDLGPDQEMADYDQPVLLEQPRALITRKRQQSSDSDPVS